MSQELVPAGPAFPTTFRATSDRSGPSPITQLLFVIFKWRRLILGVALAFTLAAVLLALLKPAVRTASARLLFKQDRAALQISGLSSSAARLPYSPQAVQSEVEMFKSRSVLLPVARELLQTKEASSPAIEAKVGTLRNNLVVAMVPETSLIEVTYSGTSRTEAENTLRLIVNSYIEQHAAAFRDSPAVLAFYEKETARAAAELKKAEDELTKWQEANGTVAIDPEITTQLEKLAGLERALNQTQADIEGNQSRLTALEGLVKKHPETYVQRRDRVPNPLIAKLQADLAAAEVALKDATNTPLVNKVKTDIITAEVALEDLRKRYTDQDRTVVEKKQQVAMLKQELANAERDAVAVAQERLKQVKAELAQAQKQADVPGAESVGPNPLREGLERDLVSARALATSLASQRDALRAQVREASTALAALRDKKVGVERLMRDVTTAREAYLTHARKLEDARIQASLDKQHLTDIAVVEAPYSTGTSDWLKRILIIVLAAFVGAGLGVAAAFTIEFFNNSVRTPEDVEFYLALPVVATIPTLPGGATARFAALPPVALTSGARPDTGPQSTKGGPRS